MYSEICEEGLQRVMLNWDRCIQRGMNAKPHLCREVCMGFQVG